MKIVDLIKTILTCVFIVFGIYGLIYESSPIFYAIFTLLSIASLLLSLKTKDNNNDEKNKKSSWDDCNDSDKNND